MENNIKEKMEKLIDSSKVFLFMKGTPEAPMCGFSAGAVKILKSLHIEFETFDVLSDEVIRQEIKEYSNWPTIPQLYIEKEFYGGFDIMKQMFETGELQKKLQC